MKPEQWWPETVLKSPVWKRPAQPWVLRLGKTRGYQGGISFPYFATSLLGRFTTCQVHVKIRLSLILTKNCLRRNTRWDSQKHWNHRASSRPNNRSCKGGARKRWTNNALSSSKSSTTQASDAKWCELLGQIKNMMHIMEGMTSAAAWENVMAKLTECHILLCATSARTWKKTMELTAGLDVF